MKKISEVVWAKIKELREKRDHAAFMIGVATVEFSRAKGISYRIIEQSEKDEVEIAKQALRNLGLDPTADELRIDSDGVVWQLMPDDRGWIKVE